MNKYIIRRIIFVSTIVLVTVVLLLILSNINKKSNKEKIELNFESRINQLNTFDSGNYYKFGWLQVQGTKIDLPILDASASEDLLDYSYGWESSFYDSKDNREVLLGHNIINVSSTPLRDNTNLMNFEELMMFVYYDFAKDNLYVQYTKNGKDELYLIYAVGFHNYDSNSSKGLKTKKEILNHIEYVRENSIYDYDIDVNSSDSLLSLVTCTRMFGLGEKQQLIVELRKVRKNEEIYKYEVKKSKLFDKLLITSNENV